MYESKQTSWLNTFKLLSCLVGRCLQWCCCILIKFQRSLIEKFRERVRLSVRSVFASVDLGSQRIGLPSQLYGAEALFVLWRATTSTEDMRALSTCTLWRFPLCQVCSARCKFSWRIQSQDAFKDNVLFQRGLLEALMDAFQLIQVIGPHGCLFSSLARLFTF